MNSKSTAYIYRDGSRVPSRPNTDVDRTIVNPDGLMGGVGITLNRSVIGGVKNYIQLNETLDIPSYWEYNVFFLEVDGQIDIDANGMINIMDKEILMST